MILIKNKNKINLKINDQYLKIFYQFIKDSLLSL